MRRHSAAGRAAALSFALALTACARTGTVYAPTHVLRIADSSDPTSLNPLLAHDQNTIGYDLLVTQTLVGLDARNRLVPVLVTQVPTAANGGISPDGKTIVYHLRKGVRFADGSPLTSADVAFTYRAILDARNPVESQDAYRRIVSLQTPTAHTVVVHLKRRWNAAVSELFAQADFAFGILPAHAFRSTDVTRGRWDERPFGTGPFRVASWRRDDRIVLDVNPYFRPRPKLHQIVLELIASTQAGLLALRSHDVDVVQVEDPSQIPSAKDIPAAHLAITPLNGEYQLLMRTTSAPTNDVRVRRAIAAAIDRAQIARASFGTLSPADSFLPPVFAWHDASGRSLRARPNEVVRDLRAAGWRKPGKTWTENGRRLRVTIAYEPTIGTWMEVLVQEQLRSVGIEARLQPFPPALFNAPAGPLRSGHFTLAMTQWLGAADPETSVVFACSQRGADGNNDTNYCNPRFDALFADQAMTRSVARRRSDFIAMQRLVRADVPLAPIAFQCNVDVVSNRVTGFERNMLMYPVDPQRWDAR